MSKLNGMQIFELLSNVSDNLIVESTPPALLVGGATAAAAGVTLAGRDSGGTPPVGSDTVTVEEQSRPAGDMTEEITNPETEAESETLAETEPETKPDPENCAHNFGSWQFTVAPTCTEGGVRTRVCPLCDKAEDEDMSAGLHVFDDHGYCKSCHMGRSILSFTSNGDGTCSVGTGEFTENESDLVIPNYSSDGDLVVSIDPEALADMTLLRSVTFPEKRLYSIGDQAFNNCTRLSGVILPEGLAVIGEQAFYGCGLTEITFPASLYKLGSGAFSNTALTEVFLPATITELGCAFSLYDKLTFEEGFVLKAVPTGLVTYCTSLKEITLPDTVTTIERYAFANSGLITVHGITDQLTHIDEIAFSECKDLTGLTIPASVTYIGNNAFLNCASLTTVKLPAALTAIDIPTGVLSIGENAFYQCRALSSVAFARGIGDHR